MNAMATTADPQLLRDVRIELLHHELRPVYVVPAERQTLPAAAGARTLLDYSTLDGRDNLAQAIVMRLLTPRGELAELGHPEYGSRLNELLGTPNTETRRGLAKLFVLEALAQEPRIAKVLDVTVTPHPDRTNELRHLVDIVIRAQPIGNADVVTIGPFTLRFAS
jgi:phage baseplate assembly protein W